MKTLYVSDLDGTLLNNDGVLSATTTKLINQLVDQGMNFTFATARSMNSASIVTKGLRLNTPLIIYNGAFIIDPISHKPLCSQFFEKEEAINILNLLCSNHQYPFVYAYINGVECVRYMEDKLHVGGHHYVQKRSNDKRFQSVNSKEALYEGDIFYITCIDEEEVLLPLYERYKQNIAIRSVFYQELYRDEYWLECMPMSVSKADAIKMLKQMYGYERIVCFGDASNDILMFQICDECYAVEEAVDELKEIATEVIGSNHVDSVALWLKEHF